MAGSRVGEFARLYERELDRLEAEVAAYPDDESLWVVGGNIANPGGTLVLHLAGTLNHYLGALLGGSGYKRDRDEEFSARNVDFSEIPVIRAVLETHDWDDVKRLFEDFDPRQWDSPPARTETETVKRKTIEEMMNRGYTEASAELTSRAVMREVAQQWD